MKDDLYTKEDVVEELMKIINREISDTPEFY